MDFEYDSRALLFGGESSSDVLVLADTHLGKTEENGEALQKEYAKFEQSIEDLVGKHSPRDVVIAGDVFHAFDFPPEEALETLQRARDFVEQHGGNLIATPGNHDSSAIPWERVVTQVVEEYTYHEDGETVCVLHGHELPDTSADTYVIGHLHPVVRVQGVKWPAYLYGKGVFDGKNVMVLPAFTQFALGTVIDSKFRPSIEFPFEDEGFGDYMAVVWDENNEETKIFPPLSKFDEYLG